MVAVRITLILAVQLPDGACRSGAVSVERGLTQHRPADASVAAIGRLSWSLLAVASPRWSLPRASKDQLH